jgi:hypothetical protein
MRISPIVRFFFFPNDAIGTASTTSHQHLLQGIGPVLIAMAYYLTAYRKSKLDLIDQACGRRFNGRCSFVSSKMQNFPTVIKELCPTVELK